MKPLITAAEVKKAVQQQEQVIFIETGGLITPAAKDAAREHGVQIIIGEKKPFVPKSKPQMEAVLGQELIASIVSQVISSLIPGGQSCLMQKEAHLSGLRLVRGDSVCLEAFNTGDPNSNVQLKELFSLKESPNLVAGLMTIDKSVFTCEIKYDEINYILEGTVDCVVDGQRFTGKAGDVLFIPGDTRIELSTPNRVRIFFVTHPGNWAAGSK